MRVYQWQCGHWHLMHGAVNRRTGMQLVFEKDAAGARVLTNEMGIIRATTDAETYMMGSDIKEWNDDRDTVVP